MKKRADITIHERGIVKSRAKAQDLIKRGYVTVDGVTIRSAHDLISPDAHIEVADMPRYVSRGGEKLDAAITHWHLNISHCVAADIGSSTGGFTDCLLTHGARRVYAIDVGKNQLDESLRKDERVISIEQTDVRRVSLPECVDFAVVDVSFISLTLIHTHVSSLVKPGGTIILLIKPQFEVGKEIAHKSRGIIRDHEAHKNVIESVRRAYESIGLRVADTIPSPTIGADGNQEFLMLIHKSA